MKTRFILISVFTIACFFSCSNEKDLDVLNSVPGALTKAGPSDVIVQWNDEKQIIDGFGVSQGHPTRLYAHRKRDELMGMLFGDQGLRLNILRGDVFHHYSPSKGVYDYAFDKDLDIPYDDPLFLVGLEEDTAPDEIKNELYRRAQLWITKQAKETYNVEKLIFSTWSPPAYMKSWGNSVGGSLKLWEYNNFAKHLTNFVKTFEANGLPIYAISPANEPEFALQSWDGCAWLSSQLGSFIVKNLGPTLRNEGLNTKIIFGECAQWSGWLWEGGNLGSKAYTTRMLDSHRSLTDFDVIAGGHGYVIPNLDGRHDFTPIVPFDKAMEKGIPVWMTEVSIVDTFDKTMENGLDWAADFHRYLSDASVSAILYWLGVVPANCDEGLIYTNKSDYTSYETSKRYETFGNFSRYIKPNSVRIAMDRGSNLPADCHISSYKYGNEYTIVVVNKTDQPVVTPVGFNGTNGIENMTRILTDESNTWTESAVSPNGNEYILDIPAKSVVTFTGTVM